MSIHWPIIRALVRSPRRVCMVDDQRSYRAAELLVPALHVAEEVQRKSRSQNVAILLPTSGALPIAALACWMLGRTVVPLNYLLKPDELRFVLDDCGADSIVTVGPMLEFVANQASKADAEGAATQPAADRFRGLNIIRMDSLDFRSIPALRWPALAADDDVGVLLYTSGTSGKPKGVMLTHGNIEANVRQVVEWAKFGPSDIVVGVLPQFHSFGLTVLTLMPLTVGAKVVFTARFVPNRIIRLFREHRPTVFIAIPSMFNALLHVKDAQPGDFSSFRYVVSGGEPLPAAVFEAFRTRFGVTINEGYGLTETSPVTNWCRPHEYRAHSVGRPLPGVIERIVDLETGKDLPAGASRDGEVRIGGPNVMKGYFNRPEETAAAFDEDRHLRTGDIGRIDEDGHLFITGRLKEMLIVGGENVFPREIEEVLNRHPSVKDSGVVGLSDPVRGELPLAFVELNEGAAFDEKAILAHCRESLAGYKVPREIRRLDVLPRNATGKVLRRELKKMGHMGQMGQIEAKAD